MLDLQTARFSSPEELQNRHHLLRDERNRLGAGFAGIIIRISLCWNFKRLILGHLRSYRHGTLWKMTASMSSSFLQQNMGKILGFKVV